VLGVVIGFTISYRFTYEDLEIKPITVRVGTAVDVVGQVGKARTISSFQTYQTPISIISNLHSLCNHGSWWVVA